MTTLQLQHFRDSLTVLSTVLRDVADQTEVIIESLGTRAGVAAGNTPTAHRSARPALVDVTTFTVNWNHKTCHLGCTVPYRLMAHLARHANQYVSHEQLLDEVWGGARSGSAMRNAVAALRKRLTSAGLEDLAAAIDGSNIGHYGLFPPKV
jgi:DNA-binding response OmpR family regulator